jgi:hypothetical protein
MSNGQPASDELHRIVPLGLTLREARAWYMNHVLMPRIRWGSVATAAGLIMLGSMLSPFGEQLEGTLVTNLIVQHFFFLAAGVLFAYGIESSMLVASRLSSKASRAQVLMGRVNLAVNKYGLLTFLAAAALIALWYMPAEFDAAIMIAYIHVEMQITMLFAGGLIFVGSRFLSKRMKLIAPIVAGKLMGLYGSLLLLTPLTIYAAYPISEQAEAGTVMIFLMLVLDFTIVPVWLYGYFGKNTPARTVVDLSQS